MKLISNARDVLLHAWSMRMVYLTILFTVLDAIQPSLLALLPELKEVLPEHVFRILSSLCILVIPVMRVIDQGIEAANKAKVSK